MSGRLCRPSSTNGISRCHDTSPTLPSSLTIPQPSLHPTLMLSCPPSPRRAHHPHIVSVALIHPHPSRRIHFFSSRLLCVRNTLAIVISRPTATFPCPAASQTRHCGQPSPVTLCLSSAPGHHWPYCHGHQLYAGASTCHVTCYLVAHYYKVHQLYHSCVSQSATSSNHVHRRQHHMSLLFCDPTSASTLATTMTN